MNRDLRAIDMFCLTPNYTRCKLYNYGYCINLKEDTGKGRYCYFLQNMPKIFRVLYCKFEKNRTIIK